MTSGVPMQAMTRSVPPHTPQCSMSMWKTRLRRCIQFMGGGGAPCTIRPDSDHRCRAGRQVTSSTNSSTPASRCTRESSAISSTPRASTTSARDSPTVAHHPDRRGTRHPRPQLARAHTPSPRSSTPWGARAGAGRGRGLAHLQAHGTRGRPARRGGRAHLRAQHPVRYKSDDHPHDRYIGGRWTVTR